MQLESARELKSSLIERLAAPLSAHAEEVAAFGVTTMRVRDLPRQQPTMALGVTKKNRRQFQLAVRVQHRGMLSSPHIDTVVREARQEADVRFIGRVRKLAAPAPTPRTRQRPLAIGTSIGHFEITAGTLGCFVTSGRSARPRILSNNHVLADENAGRRGDAILQPGPIDGGRRSRDAVATLGRFVRLRVRGTNFVDCALADVNDGVEFEPGQLPGVGALGGVVGLEDADEVQKLGRTTGHTSGRITAFELDNVTVQYDIGLVRFDDQIEVEGDTGPFSRGGDSGSLVFTGDSREGLGLLFAGSSNGGALGLGLTYVNPLERVLRELNAQLLR